MNVSITSVSARSGGEEFEVCFELGDGTHVDKRALIISSSQYLVLCPERGASNERVFDEIKYASDVWSATKRGIFILGYGACSERALMMKLVSKGFDRDIAEEAVGEIVAKGLLRTADDATRTAEKMAAKLWGERRIISALYEKGYSAADVSVAVQALRDGGIDYEQSCKRLVQKKYKDTPADPASQAKLYSALSRYGYSSSEIKAAILSLKEI